MTEEDHSKSIGDIIPNLINRLQSQQPVVPNQKISLTEENIHRVSCSVLSRDRRKVLIDVLEPYTERQGDLFNPFSLDNVFDEIIVTLKTPRDSMYNSWSYESDSGKKRHIDNPKEELKDFLRKCLVNFVRDQPAHKNCHGWEKDWSTESSLQQHLPVYSTLSFDLKSAFPNTRFRNVAKFYYQALPGSVEWIDRRDSAIALAMLSTVKNNARRGIPQGSALSPIIFNRILFPLDRELTEQCNQRGFSYTRWGDDLVVGSPKPTHLRNMLGAVDLVSRRFLIAENKVYYQRAEDGNIYLLGCKIVDGKHVVKSKEKKGDVVHYEDGVEEPVKKLNSLPFKSYMRDIDYDIWDKKD